MRRAMALATATAAWVLLIQVASTAMAPLVIVELSCVDVTRGIDATPMFVPPDGTAIVIATTTTQVVPSATLAPATTTTSTTGATAAPTSTTNTRPVPVTTTTAPPAATTTALVTTTTTAAVTTSTAVTATGDFSPAAESDFLSRISGLRASVGVAGLAPNGEFNNYARWWAKQMADSGSISHSYGSLSSLLDPWSDIGENVGSGASVASIFNGLVASTDHYDNMVNPAYTSVGVGVYVDASGFIWSAHVFGG